MRRAPGASRFLLAIGLLAALSVSGTAAAQSVASMAQPRTRVDVREAPWRGVGKLQAVAGSLRTTCTAAIISERTVLTAAHCLFNPRTGRFFPPSTLHFLTGFEGQAYVATAAGLDIKIGPGFDPAKPAETRGSDWALVVLDSRIGTPDRILPLMALPPSRGTPVMIGGYAQDNPLVLTADLACRIVGQSVDGRGQRLLRHDCATTHGISGAPVLVRGDSGWTIVGVNVARSSLYPVGVAATLEQVVWPR